MRPGVIVATFGTDAWRDRGINLAYETKAGHGVDVAWVHIPVHEYAENRWDAGAILARARNEGERQLDPDIDWLCFLDADDRLAPGYFDEMARAVGTCPFGDPACPCQDGDVCHYVDLPGAPAMAAPPPKVLVPAVEYRRPDGSVESPARNLNDGRPLLEVNHAVVGSLVPRQLFVDVGGFRALAAYEDWELWLRCERAGATFVDVPAAVYVATSRPHSRNRQNPGLLQGAYWSIRNEEERARGLR